MRQLDVSFAGGPRLTLTTGADQLLWTPSRMTWPADEQPVMHGGARALHLAIPLKPRNRGTHAGKHWVHLTYDDGHHEEVAAIAADDLARGFRPIEAAMLGEFQAKAFRVEPEEMVEVGATLWLPKPSLSDAIERFVAIRRRRYVLRPGFADALAEHLEARDPLVLREPWVRDLRQVLFASFEDIPQRLAVGYMPGWVDGGPPGWIAAPVPFVADDFVPRLLAKHFPGLYPAMYRVARELQADVDLDALREAAGLSGPLA